MTLRELRVRYEARQLDAWDRAIAVATPIHNLICLVHNMLGGKPSMKPASASELHPLRRLAQPERGKLRLTADNIEVLKHVFCSGPS